jgi:hypothetical protein
MENNQMNDWSIAEMRIDRGEAFACSWKAICVPEARPLPAKRISSFTHTICLAAPWGLLRQDTEQAMAKVGGGPPVVTPK